MKELELLEKLKQSENYTRENKKTIISGVSALLTEDCNLGCKYCYELKYHKPETAMTPEVAIRMVDFIYENQTKIKSKNGSIMLFGGEPALNVKAIKAISDRIDYYQDKYNFNFSINMVTNATIYTEELAEVFRSLIYRHGFSMQLSVDGDEETQNENRVYKNGKGSYDKVIKNIPKFKKLFENRHKSLTIHGVLSPTNIHNLYKNFIHHRVELGIEKVWFIPAQNVDWTDEHVEIYREQLDKIYHWVMNGVKNSNTIEEVANYAPFDKLLRQPESFYKPCSAGVGFVSISHDGKIYPCHQMYFSDREERDMEAGDIFNGPDYDKLKIFQDYDEEDISCPSTCDHYSCYRCIAENYAQYKSFFTQIRGRYCKMMKIDQYYENKITKELQEMGLLENKEELLKFLASEVKDKEEYEIKSNEFAKKIIEDNKNGLSCSCKFRGSFNEGKNALVKQGYIEPWPEDEKLKKNIEELEGGFFNKKETAKSLNTEKTKPVKNNNIILIKLLEVVEKLNELVEELK